MSFLYISIWVGEKTDAKERLSTNLSMIQMIDGKRQVNLLLNRALDINQDINQKILFFLFTVSCIWNEHYADDKNNHWAVDN